MANILNEFFVSIGQKLAESIPANNTNQVNNIHRAPIFELTELELLEVAILIRDLKPTSSCGVDGLNARIIKAAGPSIFPVLLHLINVSIRQHIFPRVWKVGCVTPLFKDGSKSDPSNYHPISVLPCIGKLMERVVHTQLYSYCTNSNIFSESQSGLRKGCSTTTCLIDFLANIFDNIDQGITCGVLFLDLRKAFDTVNHFW